MFIVRFYLFDKNMKIWYNVCRSQIFRGDILTNIYLQIIEKYNKQLQEIQDNDSIMLDKYMCLCCLRNIDHVDAYTQQKYIAKAKDILDIPIDKHRIGVFGKKIDAKYLKMRLLSDSSEIEALKILFDNEIKQKAIEEGLTANHVTGVSPQNLTGSNLVVSKDRFTQFGQKKGDFLFATTLLNGKKIYALRENMLDINKHHGEGVSGMIKIDDNTYLFLNGENLEITDKLKLTKPKYVYKLNINDFSPETKFGIGKEGNYCFVFDDEWHCDHNIRVLDEERKPIVDVEVIDDVTDLSHDYNLYVAKDARKALDILDAKNLSYAFTLNDALKFCVKSDYIININGQMVKSLLRQQMSEREESENTVLAKEDNLVQENIPVEQEKY